MSLLVGAGGRVRWGWRLGLFFLLALGGSFLLGGLAYALVPGLGAGGSAASPFVGVGLTLVAALLASWVVARALEGVPLAALGLPMDAGSAREAGLGFLVGGGLIAAVVALLAATGAVTWSAGAGFGAESAAGPVVATLFLCLAAMEEELLFRGYPLQLLAGRVGGPAAIGITAVGFGLLHAFNPGLDPIALLNIVLAGILLGTAYWRTFSLWFAAGVHLGWNWVMGVASDLPVSGIGPGRTGFGFLDTPGVDAATHGPAWWSGGAFGPEAGLAVTLVTLVAIAWVARTPLLGRTDRGAGATPLPLRLRDGSGGGPGGGSDPAARPGAADGENA